MSFLSAYQKILLMKYEQYRLSVKALQYLRYSG